MKSLITLLSALFLVSVLSAQDIKQQVISSAGGYDVHVVGEDTTMSLSWTLGELVIATVSAGTGEDEIILTQGFQQSELEITAIEENPELGIEVTVYPNPTSEIVNIKFSTALSGETVMFLSGPDGRTLLTEKIEAGVLLKDINMQQYPAGTYFLRIQNGIKLNVYKIIKL